MNATTVQDKTQQRLQTSSSAQNEETVKLDSYTNVPEKGRSQRSINNANNRIYKLQIHEPDDTIKFKPARVYNKWINHATERYTQSGQSRMITNISSLMKQASQIQVANIQTTNYMLVNIRQLNNYKVREATRIPETTNKASANTSCTRLPPT